MSYIERRFRLSNDAGGSGLVCTPDGLSLAGAPLLRKTAFGLEPRSIDELAALLMSVYGEDLDPRALTPGLDVVAKALDAGDLGRAMVAALQLKLPGVGLGAAERVAKTEAALSKFNFAELRDWLGRWTRWGAASASAPARARKPVHQITNEDRVRAFEILLPQFKQEFDSPRALAFSKKVWAYGYWLEQQAHEKRPFDLVAAQVQYTFLQDRLNYWLGRQDISNQERLSLISAAEMLYEGAANAGVADSNHIPKSMVAVATNAMAFEGQNPAALRLFNLEPEDLAPIVPAVQGPRQGIGAALNNLVTRIKFRQGIFEQGEPWEAYLTAILGSRLHPNSKTFDHFIETEPDGRGIAISAKVIDTSSPTYESDPRRIFNTMKSYIDAAADYKPRSKQSPVDLPPKRIIGKQIQLAVRAEASQQQRYQLFRAVRYGALRGVFVEITWIKTK